MVISHRKRHLNEIRKKAIASSKAKAAAKKLKLEAEIEQVELIEDSYDQPSDFNLSSITELKTEYIDEDFSLGVHIAPI